MHRAVARAAAVLMLVSAAPAAEPVEIRGLTIGTTQTQIEAALPHAATPSARSINICCSAW